MLYKNVEKIIKKHGHFFKVVKNTFSRENNNEIYVYGWNGRGVDMKYLKKIVAIVKCSNSRCKLYINNYNGDGKKERKIMDKKRFFWRYKTYFHSKKTK